MLFCLLYSRFISEGSYFKKQALYFFNFWFLGNRRKEDACFNLKTQSHRTDSKSEKSHSNTCILNNTESSKACFLEVSESGESILISNLVSKKFKRFYFLGPQQIPLESMLLSGYDSVENVRRF